MSGALSAGVDRARLELKMLLRSPRELWAQILGMVVVVVVAGRLADQAAPGGAVPMAWYVVSGFVAASLFFAGMLNVPQTVVAERDDGTVLRMRTLRGGLTAYLVGKLLFCAAVTVATVIGTLIAGTLATGMPLPSTVGDVAVLAWVVLLGFTAVTLLGAAIGTVLPNAREGMMYALLPAGVLFAISGVMFPVTAMPAAVQAVADAFPLKWMAQGIRAALLPDAALARQGTDGWQLPVVAAVLAAWCAVGALLAPVMLRRMARRESGSRLSARREAAEQKAAVVGR
jgi:ABC-2 type transport system permease protein